MKIASALSGRINYPIILVSVFSFIGIALLAGGAAVPSPVQATASPCIMVTGSDAKTVSVTGSAKITASDCVIAVFTQAAPAISLTGSSKVTASTVCAKSASTAGSSKITPGADASCASGRDPFVLEQEPSIGECTYTNLSYTNSSSNTLHPGVYCGNTTLAGSTKNTFAPGVYIFKDGVLKIEGSSHVSGAGVALFFTGTGSALSVGGSAKLSITAPASGTLKGFAIYLDPASHPAAQSNISGSSQMTLQGITYLPNQKMIIDGSSKIIASTLATFVVKGLELNGSSNLQAMGALPSGPAPDTTAPVIAPHDDVTAIGSSAGANVSYTVPTSTDDIDGSVAVSCTPASGSLFPLGTTEVDCSAHDAAGNNATSHFNVIVSLPPDTQAPVIEAHNDIIVGGDLSGASVSYTAPAATDDVDTSVAVSCLPASGSVFAFGTTTVTCNAQDSAGNEAIPTTFNVLVADQAAPVIAPHEDISVVGNSLGASVSYTNPTATDNVDTNVAVSCLPASGSIFTVGSTTVLCNAQDSAGNVAEATSFTVVVTVPPPMPFTMSSQPDDSYLCAPNWRDCFTGGNGSVTINLGLGSSMGAGTLKSVTIAKDESSPYVSQPWVIQLECFTDADYTQHCTDWLKPNDYNGNVSFEAAEFASISNDNKHWTADFTNPSNESNIDGSSPVKFNPDEYYQLIISDNGWSIGGYGSGEHGQPYYNITGMTL